MKAIIAQAFLGILFACLGIVTAYLFFSSIDNGGNFLFLTITIIFFGGSIFFIIRAGKSDDSVIKKITLNQHIATQKEVAETIQEHNQTIEKWKKTTESQDKLKLLQLSTQE